MPNLSRLFKSCLSAIAVIAFILFCGMRVAVVPKYPPVTYIDTSTSKQIMMVDGKPFLYIGVQYSPHRLMENYHWTWPDMEQIFRQAKSDGFTVIASPIKWRWVEPRKDDFNWQNIDRPIDAAVRQGIKLEILWFGSCTSTKSSEGSPDYVMQNYQPVLKADGTPNINSSDKAIKLDMADTNLLNREKLVMHQLMNHIRSYITNKHYPNVVIGIQVQNEPTVITNEDKTKLTDRSYSVYANSKWQLGKYTNADSFNADIQYHYVNGLAEAVKTSNYSVWTRCNWAYEQNIAKRVIKLAQNGGAHNYFDFAGDDAYTTHPDKIYQLVTDTNGWHYKNNLAMIMENAGNDDNTDQLLFNAYAGDGRYHVFEFNNSWVTDPQGMYETDFAAKTISPLPHVQKVRDMIKLLKQDWYDLATKKAGENGTAIVFFNRGFTVCNDTRLIGNTPITYNTNGAGGVAIKRDEHTYVFLSTNTAAFTIPASMRIKTLQEGYFDVNNKWVDQGDVSQAKKTFKINKGECIKLTL